MTESNCDVIVLVVEEFKQKKGYVLVKKNGAQIKATAVYRSSNVINRLRKKQICVTN